MSPIKFPSSIEAFGVSQYLTFILQITEPATPTLSLAARTASVFQNCGCVTTTMTVEMIATNQRTCVDNEIVQQVGSVVLVNPTTGAFQNGSSVMAKTTAETIPMKKQKIVPSAT